ncbi:hypothetical protein quinque_013077 [Culex quinquefasciatus]
MSDTVELERLVNCTQATILRYPWSTEYNSSVIGEFNRTEILDVLGEMITLGRSHVPREDEPVTLREFITECLFPTTKSPYELPWQQKMAWGVVFGAMLLVAITGNCIVLWIVLAHRRMRTVTNYFLLNLSVADLLMSSLNCSFNFIFMLNSDWPFGAVYCTINNFMANMSVASSVFTLVAISLDREFITECLFPTTKSPYELPWQQKMAWGVVFGAMLLVAITGNCIVLWIVLAHRRMRTVTNYFLLNLSVADLLMSSLNCSFNFIFMLNSDWPFGAVYCTINNFMANMSVASSVFTLVAISLDRCVQMDLM